MTRSRYPFTSDLSVIAAQRGRASVKAVAGAAVVLGLLALAIAATPNQPTQHKASAVQPHSPQPSGDLDPQLKLDPREIEDYRSNVHG